MIFLLLYIFLKNLSAKSIQVINLIPANLNSKISTNHLIPYTKGLEYQMKLVNHYIANQDSIDVKSAATGSILLLQHNPVYTLGSSTKDDSGPFYSVLPDGTKLEYEVQNVERGGQATFHGPGQIMLYAIIDLNFYEKDINVFLRNLEEVVIQTLREYDITGYSIPGLTGVWANDKKLAAIGIKVKRWVTIHGVCLNVNPDMRYFDNIVPCGIKDKQPGSIIEICKLRDLNEYEVSSKLINSFTKVFDSPINSFLEAENAKSYLESLNCH